MRILCASLASPTLSSDECFDLDKLCLLALLVAFFLRRGYHTRDLDSIVAVLEMLNGFSTIGYSIDETASVTIVNVATTMVALAGGA